ncbi:phage tail length tape measure family protein [Paraburkholderia phenoliruptrix]|uniref:phage tail length tape measure family protein n=1 Tax=Paraburkholderia phenoliruptrix TaxID=252970 RepID=UPI002869BDE5|nr:phage tail length tape measure family protein [Paraburkholderia phenoliruptrix]WMY06767.1 phage tail length tape measure family protein [Paraburkholderia phenoliruptrix]
MADNRTTVKVTADASGYTAELDRARRSAEAFQQSQEAAARRVEVAQKAIAEAAQTGSSASARAINNFVSQLSRTADQAGKTRAELLQMRASQLGVADSVSGYISKIEEASKHTHEFSVSSAGARREMLVLAHEASQGNWSKFGGSLMVLGERTDALSLLFSTAGLTAGAFAAAIGGVITAAVKGSEEMKQFNAALALTSNYAGLTAQSFTSMEQRVSFLSGSSLGKASEVLRDLAASGQYTASEMEGVATAILRTSQISGKALEDVSKEYAKLAEDPAKWAYEHNQSMHFMDVATYQHIEALQNAGDKHAALQTVIDAATAQVQQSSTQHLSLAAQAWRSLTSAVDEYWQHLKRQTSGNETIDDQIANLQKQRMGRFVTPQDLEAIDSQIGALRRLKRSQEDNASYQAALTQRQAAAVEAEKRVDAMRDQIMSNAEKRQKELERLNRDRATVLAGGGQFSDDDYRKMVADINEKYKDPKPKSNAGAVNSAMADMAAQNAAIESQRKAALAQARADYDTGRRSYEDYYASVRDINLKFLDEEIANAAKREQIAAGKKEQTARVQAHRDWQKLVDERAKAEQDYTNAISTFEQRRTASVQKYADQQTETLRKQKASYAASYAEMFKTPQQRVDDSQRLQLLQRFEQEKARLKEQYEGPTADQQEYAAKLQRLQASYDDQTAALEAQLAREQDIRGSYSDQMRLAITQLGSGAMTTAQTAATAFTTAWQDSANALEEFVTTGKGSFSQFTASILADMAKIALRQAEMQIFQSIGMSAFSTGGSVGHYADGGHISGAGTGTSDSIPAMLSNGEFVINAASTRKYRGLLESINSGHMAHFANGGAVGSAPSSGSGPSGGDLHFHLDGTGRGGLTAEDAKELLPVFQALVDKRMDQRMRGQGSYSYQLRYGLI